MTARPTTSAVDRDGVRVYYEVIGTGPTILATHGFSSSSHAWRGTADALKTTNRFVSWDIRGHGKSDYPDDEEAYSVALSVGDMAAILDDVESRQAILIGHSLGGFLSLEFELEYPERVAALVLVGTGPGYRRDDARDGWNKMAERFATSFEQDGLGALSNGSEVNPDAHRDASGLPRAARGILRQQDARVLEHLPVIKVPTLIVVGENDSPFLAGSQYMAAKIPGAELAVIPGSGHSPMTSAPEVFGQTVATFLERLAV